MRARYACRTYFSRGMHNVHGPMGQTNVKSTSAHVRSPFSLHPGRAGLLDNTDVFVVKELFDLSHFCAVGRFLFCLFLLPLHLAACAY